MKYKMIPIILCSCLAFSGGFADTKIDNVGSAVVTDVQAAETYSPMYNEEIKLIASVTLAEAEGEGELGKRLVIDTILNRVDSDRYPDTVKEVIFQPHQYSVIQNGRINKCLPNDDVCRLVIEELNFRTDNRVIFFNADGYSVYGKPLFKEGNHYFSGL